jgi:hypothetical protein
MVELLPVINMRDKQTYIAARMVPGLIVVVRLQDLVGKRGTPNSRCRKIEEAGGINNYLGTNKQVVLSLIAKDELLIWMTPDFYIHVIEMVRPAYITSVDGETYDGELELGQNEILRCLWETKQILAACPQVKCLGLVKGANMAQFIKHARDLLTLRTEGLMIHAGDFLRHGGGQRIRLRDRAVAIRPLAPKLYLYGVGSPKLFLELSFCDAYITFGHFVNAIKRVRFEGTKRVPYVGKYHPAVMYHNLKQMYLAVQDINKQKRFGGQEQWEDQSVAIAEQAMPQPDTRAQTAQSAVTTNDN